MEKTCKNCRWNNQGVCIAHIEILDESDLWDEKNWKFVKDEDTCEKFEETI